ncbi:hypothetical protein K501DRAFT_197614 [Backusella circina FSU 941]|nr:hypothetical protein K501DRAFT_197614 [Backusella circina FSU 941]
MTTTLHSYKLEDIVASLGCYTTVSLKDQSEYSGYLYTVDPENGHVILYTPEQPVTVIMSHVLDMLSIDTDKKIEIESMDQAMHYEGKMYDKVWLDQRRDDLIQLLEKKRISIQYEANEPVIHVLRSARVEPPYVATCVFCDNDLIRKRVRDIVLELSR